MELNGFNGDDYIYLRVAEDFSITTSKFSDGTTIYLQGKTLRFEEEELMNKVFLRHFPGMDIFAYALLENGRVETLSGEYYRRLVLKDKGRVIS